MSLQVVKNEISFSVASHDIKNIYFQLQPDVPIYDTKNVNSELVIVCDKTQIEISIDSNDCASDIYVGWTIIMNEKVRLI